MILSSQRTIVQEFWKSGSRGTTESPTQNNCLDAGDFTAPALTLSLQQDRCLTIAVLLNTQSHRLINDRSTGPVALYEGSFP